MTVWQEFRDAARFGVFLTLLLAAALTLAQTNLGTWHKLDAGPFSISAPSGWEFHQLTGVDSYVGEFVGDGVTLTFDFGRYSTELRRVKKPASILTGKSIDGRNGKLVRPRNPGNGITGVLVRLDKHNALCLWAKDLSVEQQALALKIFDTLRFGGPMPASIIPVPVPPPTKTAN